MHRALETQKLVPKSSAMSAAQRYRKSENLGQSRIRSEGDVMAMVPYRVWSPVGGLRDEVNRLFNNFGNQYGAEDTSAATAGWVPAVDILEYQDRFELAVDLPGVDPASVEVTLDKGVLSLAGERATPANKGEQAKVRLERGAGKFYRRFILPDSVDSEQIKAVSKNGVLEITIQKQAKQQPRKIKVAA
jgi:HSP20 family protein